MRCMIRVNNIHAKKDIVPLFHEISLWFSSHITVYSLNATMYSSFVSSLCS